MNDLNQIEKQVLIEAPVSKVWKAVTNAKEFSSWFGFNFSGEFEVGKAMKGSFGDGINETEIINYQKKLGVKPSGVNMPKGDIVFCTVESMKPETYFSFRWIPYSIDAEADPENEPTTLVEFIFEEVAKGTQLTIRESGFDQVPSHRRERAFRMNEGGWAGQSKNVKSYVEKA